MSNQPSDYRVKITREFNLNELRAAWLEIEHCSQQSFFQSWLWVSTWLQNMHPAPLFVKALYGKKIVAIGIFTLSTETRHFIIRSRQLRLFQTGIQEDDQIWVEYNDFLCDPNHRQPATQACINALRKGGNDWDEIVISMMSADRVTALCSALSKCHTLMNIKGYKTDLIHLRKKRISYLASLTSNTRYQINRSRKLYTQLYGELKLVFATELNMAKAFFKDAGEFHRERWHDSGFNNPRFVQFHIKLIETSFPTQHVDLVKVFAGEHLIAVTYNFIYHGTVYFYLQGLQYEQNGKLKPGLTAHSLLIEHYLRQGMDYYDFMGGKSQYKTQLAQTVQSFQVIKIQKPMIQFKIERAAQMIKHTLKPLLKH